MRAGTPKIAGLARGRWLVGLVLGSVFVPGCLLPELVIGTNSSSGGSGSVSSGGMGGDVSGGASGEGTGGASGGDAATGASGGIGGTAGSGGTGGDVGSGGDAATGGTGAGGTGGDGTGGSGPVVPDGPCDLYEEAGQACVAAYSTIRRLRSIYTGPLYQVRAGSSEYNIGGLRVTNPTEASNTTPYVTTPEPGTLHDIPQTADGFADAAVQDGICASTTCTIATLYDQSGRGNHLTVAKAGPNAGGDYTALDDFETLADTGPVTVGGRDVYSLYMEARQGYRLPLVGNGIPLKDEPVALYMLADGTRTGPQCCWDFGIVGPDPMTYAPMVTLFFGTGFWGRGAGSGPWYGADLQTGVWMGGSESGDEGWGSFTEEPGPANADNPSLKVPYALGFLKTSGGPERYALRVADVATATSVKTAYAGDYPSGAVMDHRGAVALGVAGDNSNNSWSTFYEGAIVEGFPDDATEQAVLENIQAVGYGE